MKECEHDMVPTPQYDEGPIKTGICRKCGGWYSLNNRFEHTPKERLEILRDELKEQLDVTERQMKYLISELLIVEDEINRRSQL